MAYANIKIHEKSRASPSLYNIKFQKNNRGCGESKPFND